MDKTFCISQDVSHTINYTTFMPSFLCFIKEKKMMTIFYSLFMLLLCCLFSIYSFYICFLFHLQVKGRCIEIWIQEKTRTNIHSTHSKGHVTERSFVLFLQPVALHIYDVNLSFHHIPKVLFLIDDRGPLHTLNSSSNHFETI